MGRSGLLVAATVLLLLPLPVPTGSAAIDPETYAPCSTSTSTTPPCNGAVGGGPSPTLLCYVGQPNSAWFEFDQVAPPPLPNAAGGSPGGCTNPPCSGGPAPWMPLCTIITSPNQVMSATSFWDARDGAGYILGGFRTVSGVEAGDIWRFNRGMPQLPWPATLPSGPGGTFNGLQFPDPGALPTPLGNQALAWDPQSRTAFLFGGFNGGSLTNQILAYQPDTQAATVLPTGLPVNIDLLAGTWNPTPTPVCPVGCAYLFGGRMGPLQEPGGNSVNVNCVGHSDRVYLYEPLSGSIRESPWRLPRAFYGMTAVSVGHQIYLMGGAHQEDAVAADEDADPNPQVWVCDPTATRTYSGDIGLTGLPAPQRNCDIYRFDILEGGTLTRVNPYQKPTDVPAGPAWGAGTGVASTNFCPGMRPAAFFDGRYIFAQAAATQFPCSSAGVGGMFRLDPFTPAPTSWTLGGATAPIRNMGCQSNGPGQLGQLGYTTGFFTGCSGYVFGGLIDPTGTLPPPNGPISDKVLWFGKCRPTAILHADHPQACVGWPVRFDGHHSVPGEADIAWVEWNFGDGTVVGKPWQPWPVPNPVQPNTLHPPTFPIIDHAYQAPGGYYVTMRITDLSGFQSTPPPLLVKVKSDATCKGWDPPVDPDPRVIAGVVDGFEVDTDLDGIPDIADNCAGVPNHDQADTDIDVLGDACDADLDPVFIGGSPAAPVSTPAQDGDRDGIADASDNCVAVPNHAQSDVDGDKSGDVCDADADGDLVPNDAPDGSFLDNCPLYPNSDQADANGDGIGDACVLEATAPATQASAGGDSGRAETGRAGLGAGAYALGAVAAAAVAGALVLLLRRGTRRS